MDFFDNVVNKSNAIIKERLNNPFGGSKQPVEEQAGAAANQPDQEDLAPESSNDDTTNLVEGGQDEQLQRGATKRASQDSAGGESDRNTQFANIAADAEAVAQRAAQGAKTFKTFLFSMANKAGQTVSQTAKQVKQAVESTSMLTDLTREQQAFVREHGCSLQAGKLPWQAEEADEQKAAYIKEQILSLSQDKRNFVRAPPSEADFKFDAQTSYPVALSLLKEDPNLSKMRYELVPKLVNEDTFWCNYFYRVSMLVQMSERGADAKRGWASSRSSSGEGPDEEGQHLDGDEAPNSPDYGSQERQAGSVSAPGCKQQDSFSLLDSQPADEARPVGSGEPTSTFSSKQQEQQQQQQPEQYQSSELESKESRKLVAEADDLKSKLRELNIGSLDDQGQDDDAKWEEEFERDLQEFELISGGDVDELDEEALKNEIQQLRDQAAPKQTKRAPPSKRRANR